MLRLYENNVQFYIRDLRTVCGSVGCHGNEPVWILAGGGGEIVFFLLLNCSLNGAKLSSLFSLDHCKERMFKLLLK